MTTQGRFYFAALKTGSPGEGLGVYHPESGKLLFYNDGADRFFELATGVPRFELDGIFRGWLVEQLGQRPAMWVDSFRLRWLPRA